MKKTGKVLAVVMCIAMCAAFAGCESSGGNSSQINEYEKTVPVEYKASDYVKLGDYSEFDVELEGDYSVSDEDVKKEIESEIDGLKGYRTISKDKMEKGDTVSIDLYFDIDGLDTAADSLTDTYIKLGENYMEIDGFDDQLIGQKNHATLEFTMTFPDDYEIEEYRGKEADFTVAVNGIVEEYDMTYDKLDQQFVYRNFECESVDEYKESVRTALESSMEDQKESDAKSDIIEQLEERSEIKGVPDGLKELRIAEYKNYYIYQANQNGQTIDEYLADNDLTMEKWDRQLDRYMEDMVNKELLYMAVADKEGISDDEDSYSEYLEGMKSTVGMESEEDFNQVYPDDYCRLLYCEQTVSDLLYGNATVN